MILKEWFDKIGDWLGVFHKVDLWILDASEKAANKVPRKNWMITWGKYMLTASLFLAIILSIVFGLGVTTIWDIIGMVLFGVGALAWLFGEKLPLSWFGKGKKDD